MNRKSFYLDLKTDKVISEEEYHRRMEKNIEGGLNYFGQYRDLAEAQIALDNDYSFLKNNKYWNPGDKKKSFEEVRNMIIPKKVALIRKGLYLDTFIDDTDEFIRAEVAKTGYGSDKLVTDKSKIVRQTLAKYEFELDKLVEDIEWEVRAMVAMRGYGLDKLVNDSNEYVKEAALRSIEKFQYKTANVREKNDMNDFQRLIRQAEQIKKDYPEGTRIHLSFMNDPYAPVEPGTRGTVDFVDDMGSVHMKWDNGRTLALIPGEDSFRKLTAQELAEENKHSSLDEQIDAAKSSALSNKTASESVKIKKQDIEK